MDLPGAALATVVAALVSGVTGWLTSKASAKGAQKAAAITSLTDLEKEAGQRAFAYWKDVVADQRREQERDRAEITELKKGKRADRVKIAALEKQVEALLGEVRECRALCRRLVRREEGDSQFDPQPDIAD